MAGRTSGYISSLWQALFAALVRFFSVVAHAVTHLARRVFCPPGPANTTTTPLAAAPSPPSSSPPSPSAQDAQDAQDAPFFLSPARLFLAASPQRHRCVRRNPRQSVTSTSPDDGAAMPAAKKRRGQKRAGVMSDDPKPGSPSPGPANQPCQKENVGPAPSAATPTPGPASANKSPASARAPVSAVDRSRPKVAVALSYNPQTPSAPRGQDRSRGRQSPVKQASADSKKENVVPAPKTNTGAGYQAPSPASLLSSGSQSRMQTTGTCLGDTQPPDAAPGTSENSLPSDTGIDPVVQGLERLTIDHRSNSANSITKAVVAAEDEAVPVPLTVAIPSCVRPEKKHPAAPPTPPPPPVLPGLIEPKTEEGKAERRYHLTYMREALAMGQLALYTNETPGGCVLDYRDRIIAQGMNATNVTRNGTRHAEFMALSALLSHTPKAEVTDLSALDDNSWGDVDPKDGHVFPYGQKLHPSPKVTHEIIAECVLYVTVEPCVMCASLLRQLGIKKVYFGAVNDKFGGTGGVFRVHINSRPVQRPTDRPYQNGYGPHDVSRIYRGRATVLPRDEEDGDGGNVEAGYPVEGGYLRDEAVSLLRRFYVQENGRAPQPRKKEGRAARLYAMENQHAPGSGSELSDVAGLSPLDADPPLAANDETFQGASPVSAVEDPAAPTPASA